MLGPHALRKVVTTNGQVFPYRVTLLGMSIFSGANVKCHLYEGTDASGVPIMSVDHSQPKFEHEAPLLGVEICEECGVYAEVAGTTPVIVVYYI